MDTIKLPAVYSLVKISPGTSNYKPDISQLHHKAAQVITNRSQIAHNSARLLHYLQYYRQFPGQFTHLFFCDQVVICQSFLCRFCEHDYPIIEQLFFL